MLHKGLSRDSVLDTLAAGPHGDLWFDDVGSGRHRSAIGRITPHGRITEFRKVTPAGQEVDLTPTGRSYLPSLAFIGGVWPTMAPGSDGSMWFALGLDRTHPDVERMAPDGTVLAQPVVPAGILRGVAAGPRGSLLLVQLSSRGTKILRFAADGRAQRSISLRHIYAVNVVQAAHGTLWMTTSTGIARVKP